MKPAWLYCITCRSTGRMYVGITTLSVPARWAKHVEKALRAPRYKFQLTISQYGPDDFDVVPLFRYETRDEACHAEIELIAHLNLIHAGLNASPGGEISPMLDPVACSRNIASRVGKKRAPFSQEWRDKLAAASRGRVQSAAIRAKIASANTGREFSPEHRAQHQRRSQ